VGRQKRVETFAPPVLIKWKQRYRKKKKKKKNKEGMRKNKMKKNDKKSCAQ
jgi:hypothetical protein